MTLISQKLKDLQWKKRAILIIAPSFTDTKAEQQVKLFKASQGEFEDYNLCMIEHTNEGERINFRTKESVKITEQIKGFKVFLVGLDGSVKFESSDVQPVSKFLDLIDSMPMRRNELDKR